MSYLLYGLPSFLEHLYQHGASAFRVFILGSAFSSVCRSVFAYMPFRYHIKLKVGKCWVEDGLDERPLMCWRKKLLEMDG